MALRKQRGFSMLELMITVSIGTILTGIAFATLQPIFLQSHVNSAYEKTLMLLRNTRNQAITQGHQYYVTFTSIAGANPANVQVQYQPPVVGGVAQPIQNVMTYTLPPDVDFRVQGGFPANAPDNDGTGLNAIDFESTAQPGVPLNYVVFMPDGSAQDRNGNLASGVVYITRPAGDKYTSKAITVMGSTGRVRGWFLNLQGGAAIWQQQ